MHSFYIHWHWASHLNWKAKSFNELFWTIWIPREVDPQEAVEFYKNNFSEIKDVILIASSAWAISILWILRLFSANIKKVILLNPAIHEWAIAFDDIKVSWICWKQDWWINFFSKTKTNIKFIEIEWDHSFQWKEKEINELIFKELNII